MAAPIFLAIACVGCSGTARYGIVAPAQARGEVPLNSAPSIDRDGIHYEVYQVENKVVLHFVNRTPGPIHLTGESAMFDSRGRSFAIDRQSVAPEQSGRLIVPPDLATDAAEAKRPIASEVRVGGVDEGGILPRRDDNLARPDPERSAAFHWPPGRISRFRLVFDTKKGPLTHDWALRRD